MFRNRPLTCLFLIATVLVDLVMATTDKGPGNSTWRIGMVLGQLAAMAIWSVRGQTHRLTRATCLVFLTGALVIFIEVSPDPPYVYAAFCSGYAFLVVLGTLISDLLRSPLESEVGENAANRRQIPLIEFFGWTTVVAIISFGARHMDFRFLLENDVPLIVTAMLAVPFAMAFLVRRDLRDLSTFRAITLVLVAVAAAGYLNSVRDSGAYGVAIQTAYLALWLAVLGMDKVVARARSVRELLQESNEPKLFDPQD